MIDLSQKTALVTGAAQGIGQGIATQLAVSGAKVVLVDIDEAGVTKSAEALQKNGHQVQCFAGSVVDSQFLKQMAADLDNDGGVDILVNNAGIIRDNFLSKMKEEDWDQVHGVNLKGPFLCCQAFAPKMKEKQKGKIVNIISRSWLGNVGQANYSASKSGLVGLTRTLALELARDQINVNGVSPGLIDTPMTQGLPEKVMDRLINAQPSKNMGSVDDIAAAVAFLASDRSNFITGQILHVDGGKSCGLLSL